MKPIDRHRQFEKAFKRQIGKNIKLRAQFEARFSLFRAGERDYPLNDHPLGGSLIGRRAFSITPDIRVIYIETDEKIMLLDIGTHSQVY